MKLKGKRMLSWLLTVVMVLSMLPATALAADYNDVLPKLPDSADDLNVGDTYKGTTMPTIAPDGTEWSVTEESYEQDWTKCSAVAHTHGDKCYYKSCDHKDGHLPTCYSESTSYALCECEEKGLTHTAAVTLADVVTIRGADVSWIESHPAYSVVKGVYDEAYKEAYDSASFLKEAAGKTAGVAALLGKKFCYTTSATPDKCTHICSKIGGACYTKICILDEHTHDDNCKSTFYTWTLKQKEYTITWKDYDGSELDKDTVQHGDTPAHSGTPTRTADEKYTYTFNTWEPEIVAASGDAAYTATYTPTERTYTVYWMNGTETVDTQSALFSEITAADYTGKKLDYTDNGVNYIHTGWSKVEINSEEGTATFTAQFRENAVTYPVTFDSNEGSPVNPQNVEHNAKVLKPTNPEKNGYRFDGWYSDKDLTTEWNFENDTVTGQVTLYAKWVKQVTVTFDSGEGASAVDAITMDEGNTVDTKPVPSKNTYTFVDWVDENSSVFVFGENGTKVTADITLYATWIQDINQNDVKDADETITVNVTGSGSVTVNGEKATAYVYDSTKTEAKEITVVATPADGSYVSSIVVDNGENLVVIDNFNPNRSYTYTFTASGSQTVSVVFSEAKFTLDEDGVMTFYHGIDMPSDEAVYEAVITAPAYDAAKVDTIYYLAREKQTVTVTIPAIGEIDKGGSFDISLGRKWMPIGNQVEDIDVNKVVAKAVEDIKNAENLIEAGKLIAKLSGTITTALQDYGCHEFGYNPTAAESVTELLKVTYADKQKKISDDTIEIILTDNRTATALTAKNATVTYGAYTADELKAAIAPAVTVNGSAVDGLTVSYSMEADELVNLNAGTHEVKVKFAGDKTHKPSEATVTVTVKKAPVSVSVNSQVVKYGQDYGLTVTTDPQGVDTIQFVVGLDVAEMHLEGQKPAGWKTQLNLIVPGRLAQLISGTEIPVTKLLEKLGGILPEDALNGLGDSLKNLEQQFGELSVTINGDLPENTGAYAVGAVTADANYETKAAVGYLVITPDGYKAELDWIVPDENGIVTLPAIKDGSYDLGAYVSKVHEGTVEEAEKELVDLFLGVDVDGNIVVTKDQNDLTVGAYSEISYLLNWGNTMYYAVPIARAFVVVAEPVNVQFVDENGVINGDRLFTFDGEPHALDVKIFDVNNNDITDQLDAKNLTVTYYGVRSNGEAYHSTTAPTHTGAYTAVATYVEKGADGSIQRAGVDVAVMVIKPIADAIVAVDNDHYIYDGQAYDVMQLVKSTPADAKVAVFTCGINLTGDFSEEGLSALSGQANIDFPAAADIVLKKYLPDVYTNGLSVKTVSAKIAEVSAKLEELGMTSATLDGLTKLLAELPEDMVLTFKEQADVNPSAVGAYLVVGMIFDPDYVPEFGAGVLVITPDLQETYLQFNVEDDNGIFTHKKIATADLGASAYDDEAYTAKNADATKLVKDLFIGVDAEGKLVKTGDGKTLRDGTYIQISYIGELNGRYYAAPISRSMIVAMDVADVDILDGNGNENYAQVFTYDGNAKPVTVTVDGKPAPVDGLTVKYIGSDTTVDGWYREEAPTDAGVYTVVAVYSEKDGANLVKAGGAIGVLIIEPADAEVGLNDAEYVYDGNERFATLTNGGLDYVTVAIDRKDNIVYVNMPEDTADHVDRIISLLPYETETRLRTFLEKYESFDGDVQTTVLKEELAAILDKLVAADMTAEAEALAAQLAEKVISDLQKNENVSAAIKQIKNELAAIEDTVRNEIPDEIEATLEQYIRDIVTVNGGVNVDVEQVKTDIKALISEIEGQLPAEVAAELDNLVNELVTAVKSNVDVDTLEAEITQILNDLDALAADEAKTLAKYVIGAIYSQVDMTQIEALLEQIAAKVEARGYVDYLKNMVSMIAGVYEGEIDTSAVESTLNTLISKVEEKVASGKFDADDLESLETYVDQVLTSLKTVVAQIPEGKVVFGKNPSDVGEYDCYAMNVSANYKWEFVEATLKILPIEIEVTVNNAAKVQGDNDPAFSYTITKGALINNDSLTVVYDREDGETIGTYTINANASVAGADYYQVTVVPGTLTIAEKIVAVTGVSLNKSEITLTAGSNETLAATVTPADAANKAVTWSSSNPAVATVDQNGKVVAVATGSAIITVTTVDGGKTATCTVTVNRSGGNGGNGSSGGSGGGGGAAALDTRNHYSYMVGFSDGTLQPYGNVTRGQVATIFFRLLTDDAREEYWSQTNNYSDCGESLWCNNAISTLSNMGIIDGYEDGTFRPYAKITRAQFAKIAVGFFETTKNDYQGYFSDVPADAWFSEYVEAAVNAGLIQGFQDGTYQPNAYITRAQACVIVNRALDRKPHKDHLLDKREMVTWTDCTPSDWFYADMMEATNSHDYKMVRVSGQSVEKWTEKLEQRDWTALERSWSTANSAPGGEVVR